MTFTPDSSGHVRHWLVCGPRPTPCDDRGGDEAALRRRVIAPAGPAPSSAQLGGPGPFGEPWRFYLPSANTFIDHSAFHLSLTLLDAFAVTNLVSNRMASLRCRLWATCTADLWLGAEHRTRFDPPVRAQVSPSPPLALALRPGHNRVAVRMQDLALRDTPFLVALQILDPHEYVAVALPGDPTQTQTMVAAERWLDALRSDGAGLDADPPPDFPVDVLIDRPAQTIYRSWTSGNRRFAWHEPDVGGATIRSRIAGQTLERRLEFPGNHVLAIPPAAPEDCRREYLSALAWKSDGEPVDSPFGLLARRRLDARDRPRGPRDRAGDEASLQQALDFVSDRLDNADLRLAALLRLYGLGWGDHEQRGRIRLAALNFRYGPDEPGRDGMTFAGENHELLFAGCRLIAGRLFPDDTFGCSGRSGREQAEAGHAGCLAWIGRREVEGVERLLSASDAPITVAGLLNLVDFAGDGDAASRAAALADAILARLATHTFDGVFVAPQGRVSRSVIYPHTSAAQGLLAFLIPNAVVRATTPWAVFPATSAYTVPSELAGLASGEASSTIDRAGARLHLCKSARAMLSSFEVPSPAAEGLVPGRRGDQEHLFHATLGRDCHVFVNHPGSPCDRSAGRPGFWFGNGVLPRLSQNGDTLIAIYDIPEDHPVAFTHAHWPSPTFDRTESHGGWTFGFRGQGALGLWCSAPVVLRSEIIADRELRAEGRRVAWVCVCGDAGEGPEAFVRRCAGGAPAFDPRRLTLTFEGRETGHTRPATPPQARS